MDKVKTVIPDTSYWSRYPDFVFRDPRMIPIWLIIRLYVGWIWFSAGWEKLNSSAWIGDTAGTALHGFIQGALQKTGGIHPDVSGWYASFLEKFVDHHTVFFSYAVAYGELAVGVGLILGICTVAAAFFGGVMNFNYLLAGTVSINPILLVLQILIIVAWRIAGRVGIGRYIWLLLRPLFNP